MPKSIATSILLLVFLAAPLRAQAPADRAALARWRDSLASVGDTAALLAADRAARAAAAAARGDPLVQLHEGFRQLRLADLGKYWRYGDAEKAFARAARLEPAWPWPHYARGLARFGRSEAQRRNRLNLTTRVGVGALEDAVDALVEAVKRDPAFAPALVELGRLPFRVREPAVWRRALAGLRARDAGTGAHPEVLLAVGRIEREAGAVDSAVAAFERYLGAGGRPGVAHLELARTLLLEGAPGGERHYYAGATDDDSAAVAGYREDLAVIFPDSVLAEFDAARGGERAAVLHRFWTDRDAVELREPGERLREHYRRLFHARRHFALSATRRVYWPGSGCTVRTGSLEYDDRGIVYIRHGEPTRRIRTNLFLMMPNESWRYDRPEGALLFHFGAGSDLYDYRLLESVLDLYEGCSGPFRPNARTGAPPPWDVALSRDSLDPIYGRLAARWGTASGDLVVHEERRRGRASIAVGTTTESHELRFRDTLAATVRAVAVGREGGRTLVHVAWAMPLAALPAGAAERDVRVRVVAYDAHGRPVAHRDTAPVPVVRAGGFLYGRTALAAPPGTWQYRVALQLGDSAGRVLPRDTLRVPALGRGLALSDLVLGRRSVPLTWMPPGGRDTVYLSPFTAYRADAELELYYEIYGAVPGAELEGELAIVPQGRGLLRRTPAPIRVAFRERAAGDPSPGRRSVALDALSPGRYVLELTVTDGTGRRAVRRTGFEITR